MLPPILNLLEADYHPLLIVGVGQGNLHDTLLSGIRFELVSSLGLSKSAIHDRTLTFVGIACVSTHRVLDASYLGFYHFFHLAASSYETFPS